ncbi:MAG: hypothetical protein Q4D56_06685 [Bacteroides sp.]|nr:hypothetical protein [Bacteroides sp.]
MLTIYDSLGNKQAEIEPNDSSSQSKEVQSDNELNLTFTHYDFINLDVNYYTDFAGERYWLMERYTPKQISDGEWEYDMKLYGIESLIKRFLVIETTDGNAEPVFTLTASPAEHVAMIVKCINSGMGTEDWKVGRVDGTDNITIDYEGKYCDEALKEIAEAVGGKAEWWVEGQTVNICRCEHGEEITLGYNKGLTELERDTSNTNQFYTRLFPIGSSRNIDAEKYGYSRLMLPGGKQYVELHVDEYGIFDRYESDAFSGIYPRRVGTVSSVRSEEVTDEDGTTFTVYYFKDDTLDFDPNDYELAGETKRVSFQDGDLAGLGSTEDHYFEVNYDSNTKEFEIITIWPYDDDTQLPGGSLVPRVGDSYILWNISMPDEYYTAAEEEFAAAVEAYNEEEWQDISVYKSSTDHVYIEENGIDLYIGLRIRLESEKYFPDTGYKSSRITKITRKVKLPGQMDIEISDALQTGALDRVNNDVSELRTYVKSKTESSALPDIVRTGDSTLLTDNNLLSARRTIKEILSRALSRTGDDIAQGLIRFLKGIKIGSGSHGITIESDGVIAILDILQGLTKIASTGFSSGELGSGFVLKQENGRSYLEVDEILARKIAYFVSVAIKELKHVGGSIILSPASMTCYKVEEHTITEVTDADGNVTQVDNGVPDDVYRCYFQQDDGEKSISQQFVVGDQARCQTYNIKSGTSYNVSNAYYWRLVVGVGDDYIDLSKTDCDEGSGIPSAKDEIVQLGNRTDTTRQNAIILSAVGDDAPSIKQYKGINSYSLTDEMAVTILSPSGNSIVGKFISVATGKSIDEALSEIITDMENLQADMDLVREQTDKEYTLWFYDEDPTLTNLPASEWTTDELLALHVEDMYYNRTTGYAYRFELNDDGTYSWNSITDQQTIKALEDAAVAQDTADSKRRVFVEQPTDAQAYDVGDMWVNASYTEGEVTYYMNDSLVCIASKAKGEAFSIVHWQASSNATTANIKNLEDRILLQVSEHVSTINGTITSMQSTIEQQASSISVLTSRFNEDGTLANTSGLVTTADFATLFTSAMTDNEVVVKSEITSFVSMDENGVLQSGVTISADQINFLGKTIINGNFVVAEDGSLTVNNATVSGTLSGVTGTFSKLTCVNASGDEMGSIAFGAGGGVSIAAADGSSILMGSNIYHNGASTLTFFGVNLWARSTFGARRRTFIQCTGSALYYYPYGVDGSSAYVELTSATDSAGNKYYTIPLYGVLDNIAAGMPVDTVVFRCTVTSVNRYVLSFTETQRVLLVNVYTSTIYLVVNGADVALPPRSVREAVCYASLCYPTIGDSVLGRGILLGPVYENASWS